MDASARELPARKEVFRLEIIRQDNHSLQGQILWANEDKRQGFRSALELIHLISSAVAGEDEYRTFSDRYVFCDEDKNGVPGKMRDDISHLVAGVRT